MDEDVTQGPSAKPPPPRPPAPNKLMAIVRFLADHTDKIIFGDHARDRMLERGFNDEDVYRVLRLGDLDGQIEMADRPGDWKAKIVAKLRGTRRAGVVVIVLIEEELFVKTVEWEDT